MSEIVKHEFNGFLFEAGNAKKLAEIITKILKDREILTKIRENMLCTQQKKFLQV